MEKETLQKQLDNLCKHLTDQRNSDGFWTGRLSSSALATAVAIVALKMNGDADCEERVLKGIQWLYANVNLDGGFGDTPESESNVSTSLLCYAAINYCKGEDDVSGQTLLGMESFLHGQNISIKSEDIAKLVLNYYGKDLTFSVPILSMLVICGVVNTDVVKKIPQLPFELSLLPSSFYRFFNLQVVSYAIPALIAVGIYIFKKRNKKNFTTKAIRNASIEPALRKLESIMPESGGFLEAIPLTAFTSMCLVASGYKENSIVKKTIEFLNDQQREDGSWAIDTDLSTWVTTLSIKALGDRINNFLPAESVQKLRDHLLAIQYKEKHPFNDASSGGWGWTSFAGSVPDADDTSGAILGLLVMYNGSAEEDNAIITGCGWLSNLQNSDGGLPTFCRGWGRLPFDSSSADLTGHALLAWLKAIDTLGEKIPLALQKQFRRSISCAISFLQKEQHSAGYWLPLWFGSQLTDQKTNPVYGTARVGAYIYDCLQCKSIDFKVASKLEILISKASKYLLSQQNNDGSWGARKGTKGTIEETALAISFLSNFDRQACMLGLHWLELESRNGLKSNPIGLYFATLWYDEQLYPLTYYIDAVKRMLVSV